MGQQIQRTGSAILAVQLVEELEERAFDSAKELLPQGAVNVREDVEGIQCTLLRGRSRRPV